MLFLTENLELPWGTNIAQQAFYYMSKTFDFHSRHFISLWFLGNKSEAPIDQHWLWRSGKKKGILCSDFYTESQKSGCWRKCTILLKCGFVAIVVIWLWLGHLTLTFPACAFFSWHHFVFEVIIYSLPPSSQINALQKTRSTTDSVSLEICLVEFQKIDWVNEKEQEHIIGLT